MSQTLFPASESSHLRAHPEMSFAADGFRYSITLSGGQARYEVTDGTNFLRTPLLWAFGSGRTGQTFVFRVDGQFYESRVSYYRALSGLDRTIGSSNSKPATLTEAAGRLMNDADVNGCFGCHSGPLPGSKAKPPEALVPGVTCEKCHGSGDAHLLGFKSAKAAPGPITSFKKATSEEISEACGQCHRTWEQVLLLKIRGVNTVRFQPYRLAESKCYDAEDRRASCLACHDPHRPHDMSTKRIDSACLSCHRAAAKKNPCTHGTENCASCHMPKYDLPGAHAAFTDHRIRLSKPGDPYPE